MNIAGPFLSLQWLRITGTASTFNPWIFNINFLFKMGNLGPPCVAYSKMGKRLGEGDASFAAHESHYEMIDDDAEEFDVAIIENVPEYTEETVKKRLKPHKWGMDSEVLDPRLFGQRASRPRRYFICWRRSKVEWDAPWSMQEVLLALRTCPTMDPLKYFWKSLPPSVLSASQDLLTRTCPKHFLFVFTRRWLYIYI